jgi:hypothetical protein
MPFRRFTRPQWRGAYPVAPSVSERRARLGQAWELGRWPEVSPQLSLYQWASVSRSLEPGIERVACLRRLRKGAPLPPWFWGVKANKSNGINKNLGKVRNAKANLTGEGANKSFEIRHGCAKVREK